MPRGFFFTGKLVLVFLPLAILGIIAGEILYLALPTENQKMIHNFVHEVAVVGDNDDAALETTQVFLQDIQRNDIEVVRRLVEHEEVRVAHQDGAEVEPPLFPAAQLIDIVVLLVGREEEIGQELGDRHPPTVAEVDIFRDALDDVDDLHLLVELQPFLAIIPEAHSLADIESSAVGRHFSHQHFNKGRFPRPVVADDAQLLVAGEDIVEVFRDDNVVEAL